MRLFIAIDLPEDIKVELRNLQKEFKGQGKFYFVKDFHLTLKFLGEVEENKVEEIKDRLKDIKVGKFDLMLQDLGSFPNEDYVKVLWVGCPNKEIIELHEKIDECLKGLFKKEYRFSGHITLARVKFVKDKEGFVKCLKEIKVEEKTIEVKDFRLVKSTLTSEGPVYEDLGVYC